VCVVVAGCGPSDPLAEVKKLHRSGRHVESIDPLRRLLDERENDAEVHYLYGVSLLRTGQPSLAIWSFRKAMLDSKWLVPASLQLATGALLTGNHDAALEALDRALEFEPDHVGALLLRAQARVNSRRDYEGALSDADRALELDPDAIEAHVPRTVALLGLERLEEAESSLRVLQDTHREAGLAGADMPRFCIANALFARESERLEEAAKLYDACLERHPSDLRVVQEAVEFFEEARNFTRAMEILRGALEREPNALVYRVALAARLRTRGEVAEAERLLREGADGDDARFVVPAWMALADHLRQVEDLEAALGALRQAVAVAGEPTPELAFALADALVVTGRFQDALAAADLLGVPAQRELIYGRTRLLQGRPKEALEHFSKGLALWPDNAVARYYAALAAEHVGDFERAIAEYRYALRSDPDATDARLRLALLHEAEGEHRLALMAAVHGTTRGDRSLDLETQLAALRASARIGRLSQWRYPFGPLIGRPGVWARVVMAAAEGVRDRAGPRAAADLIRGAERLDLVDPRNALALRALVIALEESGDSESADEYLDAALAETPAEAEFVAIRALLLERRGAPRSAIEATHLRALALDARNVTALMGLGRLTGDAQSRLAYYTRAAESDPAHVAAQIARSDALSENRRPVEAKAQLEQVLSLHPYDPDAAQRLAELMLRDDGSAGSDRVLELCRRAVRFGNGSPESFDLLRRVHDRRGEIELAADAAASAKRARAERDSL
jgi:tetratricopeptide (TPR) repeat protein